MTINWLKPRVILRSIATIKEEELQNQIKSLSSMQYGVILQMIDQLELEANDGAAASVGNPAICASCVGGAEHMRMLKERLEVKRHAKEEKPAKKIV